MHSYVPYYYFLGRKSYGMLPHGAMAWAIAVNRWWYAKSSVLPSYWAIGPMPREDRYRTHTKPSYVDGVFQY